MNVGSLFSGIGGFDLGLERAGMHVAWQCESNPYRRAVLAERWPGVLCYPDVCDVRAADVEPVDVLCGGFPCTDISLAGRGAGLEGDQSRLWWEMHRCVGELRPRYVIVENVSAFLARGLDAVLGSLSEIGYDAEWDCLRAADFGAPHLRDRLWLVAYPEVDGRGPRRAGRSAGAGARQADCLRPQDMAHPGQDGFGRSEERNSEAAEGERATPCRDNADRRADPERRHGAAGHCVATGAVADAPRDAEAGPASEPGAQRERARPSGERGGAAELADSGLKGLEGRGDGSVRPGPASRGGQAVADAEVESVGTGLRESRSGRVGRGRPGDSRSTGGPWSLEPDVGRVADGIPARVDRLAALGDALVPQIAEWIGQRIMDYENAHERSAA